MARGSHREESECARARRWALAGLDGKGKKGAIAMVLSWPWGCDNKGEGMKKAMLQGSAMGNTSA